MWKSQVTRNPPLHGANFSTRAFASMKSTARAADWKIFTWPSPKRRRLPDEPDCLDFPQGKRGTPHERTGPGLAASAFGHHVGAEPAAGEQHRAQPARQRPGGLYGDGY